MPRSVTPKHKTRWIIFDTKNMKLHSWLFFPTKKDAEKWIKKEFRNELPEKVVNGEISLDEYWKNPEGIENTRPKWYPRKDWERRKGFFDNHIIIARARWHVSRYDALQHNLVETKGDNE